MTSRFWADGDGDSDASAEEETQSTDVAPTRAYVTRWVTVDSDSDDSDTVPRVATSGTERMRQKMTMACTVLARHMAADDWAAILVALTALMKLFTKRSMAVRAITTMALRTIVRLEDLVAATLARATGDRETMAKTGKRAFFRVKSQLRKHVVGTLRDQVDAVSTSPEEMVEGAESDEDDDSSSSEDESEEEDDDESSDDTSSPAVSDVDGQQVEEEDDVWASGVSASSESDDEDEDEQQGRAKWLKQPSGPRPRAQKAPRRPAKDHRSRPDHDTPAHDTSGLDVETEIDDAHAGFLAAAAEATYGASSLWLDPELLRVRLDADEITLVDATSSKESTRVVDVYAATYRSDPVAVTRLSDAGKTLVNAAALASQGKSLYSLVHRNLVEILGVSWTKALDVQVVTRVSERGDLRSLLDAFDADAAVAASLTWRDSKGRVAIDVALALAYLHQQNFSAGLGGLTSRTVLVDGDGTARLNLVQLPCSDVAAAQDRRPSPLRWVAPEVVRGRLATSSADMYALGVVLTELDTTKYPFYNAISPNGAAMEDMLIAACVAKGDLMPTLSVVCPQAIRELVDKCLSLDPAQRPRADQVVYALRAMLKDM